MLETLKRKYKPLPRGEDYDYIFAHLQRVQEQPTGAAKGNHAALIKAVADVTGEKLNKVDAINFAAYLIGEDDFVNYS